MAWADSSPIKIEKNLLLNLGNGTFLQADKILLICPMDRTTFKNIVNRKREKDLVIDNTAGKKRRSLILLDEDERVILCSFSPEALLRRLHLLTEEVIAESRRVK